MTSISCEPGSISLVYGEGSLLSYTMVLMKFSAKTMDSTYLFRDSSRMLCLGR